MKIVARSAALGVLFFATVASAQVYYPQTYTPPTYTTPTSASACVILTSDLSFGSRGVEVTKLQQFLVSQNYPGGGSWMITGYFGQATMQAVRNFQQAAGLPMTGYVDAATRSAIQSRTCGLLGTAYPQTNIAPTYPLPTPTYPITTPTYAPTTPTYPTYPTGNVPYMPAFLGGVSITSLSTQSAQIGTSITIYGSGFDTTGTNTVHVGGATVIVSSNGTSITFAVPSVPNGQYSVYITNSRGTSNSISLYVSQAQSVCNQTPWYQPWQWWGQTQYQCGVYSNVLLDSLSPNWAAVGTTITVKGNGFSATGNTVYMGGRVVATVASTNNGTELTFIVPQQLQGPYGLQQIVPGHYPVRVVNGTGAQSNSLTLSITQGSTSLSISSASGLTSLQAGTQGTWTLVVNAPYGSYLTTTVNWGDSSSPYTSSMAPTYLSGMQTLTFTHVYANVGTYTITFTVSSANNTTSATKTVTVTPAPSGGALSLNSLTPMQGAVGTTVTLNGSGFTSTDNVVHFGIGGSRNVSSTNSGTQISYLIPTYISACDLIQPGYFCGAPTQTVTPGVYPIYVTNSTGATNVLYFTVQ